MLTIITIWIVKMRMCVWTEFALMATRGELHRFVYWPQCIYSGDSIPSCSQRLRSYVEAIVLCIGYSAFTVAIPSYCPNLYWPQCIYSGDSSPSCSQRLRSYVEVIVLCIGYSAFTVAIPS